MPSTRKIAKSKMRITINKKSNKKRTKRLVLKKIKFDKTVKKMRAIARKTMKASLRGASSIRKGLYKKVDVAVSKAINDVVVQTTINVVNKYLETKGITKTAKARSLKSA
jgi:hypothetical protein